ncbi:MAG: Gfo/Idh/MocA family oxidoreductase [Candidatus Thioglobus sp.]|nr:Gfo/Idh/MocA family oxidoreductase [Candidatus Thioglobus sp.]
MTDKIKYAIIGAGCMGQEHILNIEIIEDAEVVALCDTSEQSIKECLELLNNEVAIFEDYNELVRANIADAFIIATPNFTHIDVLKDVMKSEAHLLIEKPLCTTVKDCQEFEELSKNYPGVIWTAMEYRYMPPVQRMIQEIHNKTIGDLKMLSIREHRFPFLHKVDDWNRFTIKTGGTLVEKCCHFFDLMRLIAQSEPLKVYASGNQDVNHLDEEYDGKVPDILDNAFVIVDFKNGVRAFLDLCMFAENSEYQEELCAVGTIGKIETEVPSNQSGISNSDLRIGLRENNSVINETIAVDAKILEVGHHHGSTYYEHKSFIKAIRNNTKPEVSLNDGLIAVAIGEAAETSIKEGRVVQMSEFNL